jgi:gliding motility-associated-like protein
MQKAGHLRISLLVLLFCFGLNNVLLAQAPLTGFTWKLLEVTDPSTEAKIQFTPLVPAPAQFTGWDFGDGTTNLIDSIATHSYTTQDTLDVQYSFKFNASDSIITQKVNANSAAFFVRLDSSTNVTYVRILRSAFLFPLNDITTHGAMRFEWSVDGTVLTDLNYQFPNIRYAFEHAGLFNVALKVWNVADPLKFSTFSRNINVLPDFTAKVKFPNIPNVFTPNGDKTHDYFEVQTSGTSRLVFKVFSRGGSLVYQNQATFIKWNGKNDNGRDLPEGIYYYIIEDLDNQYENAKGFVYILRGK